MSGLHPLLPLPLALCAPVLLAENRAKPRDPRARHQSASRRNRFRRTHKIMGDHGTGETSRDHCTAGFLDLSCRISLQQLLNPPIPCTELPAISTTDKMEALAVGGARVEDAAVGSARVTVSGARVEDAAVSGAGVGGDVAGYSAEVFGPDRRSRQISNKSDLDLQGPLSKQSLAPVTASASI